MTFQWLRLWVDALDDEKLKLLAFEDRWHYIAILIMKRKGILDHDEDAGFRDRKVGVKLGLGDRDRDEVRRRLIEVQLIDEHWQPLGWDKRQFDSDSSTSRVQAFRKRSRNVSRPFRKRPQIQTQSQIQTQITDTEKNQEAAAPQGLDAGAWQKWVEYRKERKPEIKGKSIAAAQRQLAAFGDQQALVVDYSIANSYQGLFAPKNNAVGKKPYKPAPTVAEMEADIAAGRRDANGSLIRASQ